MAKFSYFFFLIFLFSNFLFAQIGVSKRLEMEIQKKLGDDFRVLNLGEKGILLMLESQETLKQSKREILLTFYDTLLNSKWTRSIVVDQLSKLDKSCMENQEMYFLMNKQDYDYEIWKINLENGMPEKIAYEKLTDFEISRFDVLNKVLILGGEVKNSPTVFLYDYQKGKALKPLTNLHGMKANLNQMVTLPNDSTFALVLGSKNYADSKLYFSVYDNYGKLLRNWEQEPQEDRYLLTYRLYFANKEEMYLFGTYSLNKIGRAQGIYAGYFVGKEQKSLRYYDFSYLNNFLNHLGEKKKAKVLEKAKEKREKGKVYQLDFSLFVRDLQVNNDRILLILESYLPVYAESTGSSTLGRMSWLNMNNNSYYNRLFYDRLLDNNPINRRSPLIYKYKHAAVCAFDRSGKLLWDNEFTYEDLESPSPLFFTETSLKADSAVILHLQEDKLYLKRTHKSFPVEKNISFSLEKQTGNELDKIENREDEGLSYWYGKYFVLFGQQEIRQMQANNNFLKRKVFYLSKIYDNGENPKEEPDKKR